MTQKNNITPVNLKAINRVPGIITDIPSTVSDFDIAKKLCQIYSSANERGIPCSLSIKKLKLLLKSTNCYYTGIKFDEVHIRSIDRVNNDLGYIDSNLVASDKIFNSRKANLTLNDIDVLYKKVSKFINPKKNVKKKISTCKKSSANNQKSIRSNSKSDSLKKTSSKEKLA